MLFGAAPFRPGFGQFWFSWIRRWCRCSQVASMSNLALGKRQTIFKTDLQVMNMTGMELILIAGLFGVIGLGVFFLRRRKQPENGQDFAELRGQLAQMASQSNE